MNIVITGGTGYIGQALTTQLVKNGDLVTILSRDPGRINLPPGVRAAAWDGHSANGWEELADQADVMINLAGANLSSKRWTPAYKKTLLRSRVQAGEAVVAALRQASPRPRVLIQASGIGYYGNSETEMFTESEPPGNDFFGGVASRWEQSTQTVEELGVRRAIVRSAVVISRNAKLMKLMALPFRLFVGGPIGSGRQWLPWIHLEDEIRAIRFLIENEKASGPFNLVAPDAVRNAEFGRTLASVLHRPYWFPVPAFALRLVLGDMSSLILEGQRAVPERLTNLGFEFRYPNLKQALEGIFQKKS